VLENECGRVSDFVFEKVKTLHPKQLALDTAENLILENLTMCTPRQACDVMQELESRILNYENNYLQESRTECINLLQSLSDKMITLPTISSREELANFGIVLTQLKQQYSECISKFVE
jgi:hypothetical protein